MKITTLSPAGIDLIKSFEGFSAAPYADPVGIPTIGYGTIRYPDGTKVTLADPHITEEQAVIYLRHDAHSAELAVDALCRDSITQNQFDSLVSFAYNCGNNALKTSTLLKRVNSQTGDIRAAFLMWNKADGKVLKGLTVRRGKEADLYLG
jgi:lysozyme